MFLEALKLSLSNIWSHKLRSFLAILGVTFGIGAVIAITTMTAGIEHSVVDVVTKELFKADMMALYTTDPFGFLSNRLIFTERDIKKIEGMPNVKAVEALGFVRSRGLYFNHERVLNDAIRAMSKMEIIPLKEGRVVGGRGEIVLGSETAKELRERTGNQELLGKELLLRYEKEGKLVEEPLKIIGIAKEVPYAERTLFSYVSLDYYDETIVLDDQDFRAFPAIIILVSDVDKLADTRQKVESYLKDEGSDLHRLAPKDIKLEVDTLEDVVQDVKKQIGKFTSFLGAIGAVALFVGMIGIMNIMLMGVRERTREIGIMKATGATDGDILRLFLLEAVIICLVGAGIGIVIGTFGSIGLSSMVASLTNVERVPFVFTTGWYVIAIITGIFVGLVSGVYPAWSAARVDPIRALRYE